MKWGSMAGVAGKSIRKNGLRSLLTMLGIVIGVGSVVVMVALGQGAQVDVEARISQLGSNLVMVLPGASSAGGVSRGAASLSTLTLDDVDWLQEHARWLDAVSPDVRANVQAIAGSANWSTTVHGVGPDYPQIKAWELKAGAFFTERELATNAKVAVLGHDVAEALFPDQDPLGERVRLRNVPFTVVGVLEAKGAAMGISQDDTILAPATTVRHSLSGGSNIDMIVASAVSEDRIDDAVAELGGLLRTSHRLQPAEPSDFDIRTQSEITETATAVTETLTLLLAAVAGVSLVVGGIGIMNIMLVSVTERTREIGLRLAVGARGSDILSQFIVEALVLAWLGGAAGAVVGVGVCEALSHFFGLAVAYSVPVMALAFLFSGAVGVFFGLYPARKAAALEPIAALRFE